MTMGVRTEYEMNANRKRDYLTVWSGSFMSVYEAIGVSLPKMNGYMLTTYNDDRVRVECPAPRTEGNHQAVDEAITKALREHYASIGAKSLQESLAEVRKQDIANYQGSGHGAEGQS